MFIPSSYDTSPDPSLNFIRSFAIDIRVETKKAILEKKKYFSESQPNQCSECSAYFMRNSLSLSENNFEKKWICDFCFKKNIKKIPQEKLYEKIYFPTFEKKRNNMIFVLDCSAYVEIEKLNFRKELLEKIMNIKSVYKNSGLTFIMCSVHIQLYYENNFIDCLEYGQDQETYEGCSKFGSECAEKIKEKNYDFNSDIISKLIKNIEFKGKSTIGSGLTIAISLAKNLNADHTSIVIIGSGHVNQSFLKTEKNFEIPINFKRDLDNLMIIANLESYYYYFFSFYSIFFGENCNIPNILNLSGKSLKNSKFYEIKTIQDFKKNIDEIDIEFLHPSKMEKQIMLFHSKNIEIIPNQIDLFKKNENFWEIELKKNKVEEVFGFKYSFINDNNSKQKELNPIIFQIIVKYNDFTVITAKEIIEKKKSKLDYCYFNFSVINFVFLNELEKNKELNKKYLLFVEDYQLITSIKNNQDIEKMIEFLKYSSKKKIDFSSIKKMSYK